MYRLTIESKTLDGLREKLAEYLAMALGERKKEIAATQDASQPEQDVTATEGHKTSVPLPTPVLPQPKAPTPQPAESIVPLMDANHAVWDGRIHSKGKTFNKNGAWRYQKGVDKNTIKQIEQEIKAGSGVQPVSNSSNPTPIEQPIITPDPIPITPQQPPVTPITAPQQTPVNPVQATFEKPAHSLKSFQDNILTVVVDLMRAKKIDQHYINELKNYFGVKEIWEVFGKPEQAKELYDNFCNSGLITRMAEC